MSAGRRGQAFSCRPPIRRYRCLEIGNVGRRYRESNGHGCKWSCCPAPSSCNRLCQSWVKITMLQGKLRKNIYSIVCCPAHSASISHADTAIFLLFRLIFSFSSFFLRVPRGICAEIQRKQMIFFSFFSLWVPGGVWAEIQPKQMRGSIIDHEPLSWFRVEGWGLRV